MEKERSGTGATLMKTKSSGARAGDMFMKRIISKPELCHFYDGPAALKQSTI